MQQLQTDMLVFTRGLDGGVVPGLHICISTEDLRQHNLTLISQRKAASQPCRFSSPFMWQQKFVGFFCGDFPGMTLDKMLIRAFLGKCADTFSFFFLLIKTAL